MQAIIAKWGNSLALRLPRHIVEEARIVDGATVTLEVEDGSIRITPTRPKFKLADLLSNEKKAAEFDWGKPKGEEVW